MAEVPDGLRAGLRSFIIAVAGRDSRGLVAAAREIGVLLPGADTRELERALSTLFARFGGMGFAELRDVDPQEFTGFATEFGDTIRHLPVQFPENLLLLMRAVGLTSGLCSALDADFNIWEPIAPYATRLLRDESGAVAKEIGKDAVANAGILWRLPRRVDALLDDVGDGVVSFDTSRLERRLDRLEHIARRIASGVLFAAFLVGGAVALVPAPPLGVTLMAVSVLPLLHSLFARAQR